MKFFEIIIPATVYEVDDLNGVAYPKKNSVGKYIQLKKGKVIRTLQGETKNLKTQEGKQLFVLLISGEAVKKENVKPIEESHFEKDCDTCDKSPVAGEVNFDKEKDMNIISQLDKKKSGSH